MASQFLAPALPKARQLPLAVTMGEPAGVGTEVTLRAWQAQSQRSIPAFFLVDDPDRVRYVARRLAWDIPVREVPSGLDARGVFAEALPVVAMPQMPAIDLGRPNPEGAEAVLSSIRQAVRMTMEGEASGVVTNPIHKGVLYEAGFQFPGHTELLASLTDAGTAPVMMLACPELRVVPVTVHNSLREAIDQLTMASIIHCARVTAAALRRDFGISQPRLSVAALNPHAGEGGALGREEIEIIQPAVDELRIDGVAVDGPHPADTLFHRRSRGTYDAAICMYHDQALIPLKTIDFHRGVNITLGLPIIRTSPDHGTALDIAGKGIANPASMIQAL
ncbi:MAG: 4-hydroxythreonine-4-phosphate dehydrogenase PdxA, partial [Pseudomonadota bacterium]